MIKFTVGENQGNQRLDRFLKKYFAKSSLSHVYKLIRKDVKVNGRRKSPETLLEPGDEITIYNSAEEAEAMQRKAKEVRAKKQFSVVYEDENILAVEKPFGLLTHGDGKEKKNHLANQVLDYLIAKGDYVPAEEKTFVPSPANRLDRNTTGLVLFGKTSAALRELNGMLRERGAIDNYVRPHRRSDASQRRDDQRQKEKHSFYKRRRRKTDGYRNLSAGLQPGRQIHSGSSKDQYGPDPSDKSTACRSRPSDNRRHKIRKRKNQSNRKKAIWPHDTSASCWTNRVQKLQGRRPALLFAGERNYLPASREFCKNKRRYFWKKLIVEIINERSL